MIYVGVVGSRERHSYEDYKELKKHLEAFVLGKDVTKVTFVSGGCSRGADFFIKQLSKELASHMQFEFPLLEFLPNIPEGNEESYGETRGKIVQAYYDRNFKIAAVSDYLFALVKNKKVFEGGTGNTCMHFIDMKGREKLVLV